MIRSRSPHRFSALAEGVESQTDLHFQREGKVLGMGMEACFVGGSPVLARGVRSNRGVLTKALRGMTQQGSAGPRPNRKLEGGKKMYPSMDSSFGLGISLELRHGHSHG